MWSLLGLRIFQQNFSYQLRPLSSDPAPWYCWQWGNKDKPVSARGMLGVWDNCFYNSQRLWIAALKVIYLKFYRDYFKELDEVELRTRAVVSCHWEFRPGFSLLLALWTLGKFFPFEPDSSFVKWSNKRIYFTEISWELNEMTQAECLAQELTHSA